jgi:hypothetical protein
MQRHVTEVFSDEIKTKGIVHVRSQKHVSFATGQTRTTRDIICPT